MSWEDSRICDGVRDSKILWDAPSTFDHNSDKFWKDSHRVVAGSRHHLKYDVHRVGRDFPRVSAVEIGDKFQRQRCSIAESNKYWARSKLPIFRETPYLSGEQQGWKDVSFASNFDEIESWFSGYMRKEASSLGFYKRNTKSESIIVRFKRNLPVFDGTWHTEDFMSWVDDIEDFFEEVNPPVHLKYGIVLYKMKGDAYDRWKQLQYDRLLEGKDVITSWPRMRRLLISEFVPRNCSMKGLLEVHNNNLGEGNMKHTNCLRKVPLQPVSSSLEENIVCKIVDDPFHTSEISRTEVSIEDDEFSEEKSEFNEGAEVDKHAKEEGAEVIEGLQIDKFMRTMCSIKFPSELNINEQAREISCKTTSERNHMGSNTVVQFDANETHECKDFPPIITVEEESGLLDQTLEELTEQLDSEENIDSTDVGKMPMDDGTKGLIKMQLNGVVASSVSNKQVSAQEHINTCAERCVTFDDLFPFHVFRYESVFDDIFHRSFDPGGNRRNETGTNAGHEMRQEIMLAGASSYHGNVLNRKPEGRQCSVSQTIPIVCEKFEFEVIHLKFNMDDTLDLMCIRNLFLAANEENNEDILCVPERVGSDDRKTYGCSVTDRHINLNLLEILCELENIGPPAFECLQDLKGFGEGKPCNSIYNYHVYRPCNIRMLGKILIENFDPGGNDVPCRNRVTMTGLDQCIIKNTILTNDEEDDARRIRTMKFFISPIAPIAVSAYSKRSLHVVCIHYKNPLTRHPLLSGKNASWHSLDILDDPLFSHFSATMREPQVDPSSCPTTCLILNNILQRNGSSSLLLLLYFPQGGLINTSVKSEQILVMKLSLSRGIFYMMMQWPSAICGAIMVKDFQQAIFENSGEVSNSVSHEYAKCEDFGAEILGAFILLQLAFFVAKRNARDSHVPILHALSMGLALFLGHLATIPKISTHNSHARNYGATIVPNRASDDHWIVWMGLFGVVGTKMHEGQKMARQPSTRGFLYVLVENEVDNVKKSVTGTYDKHLVKHFRTIWKVRLFYGVFGSRRDLQTGTGLHLTRGLVIPLEGWNDEDNANTFNMTNRSVVTFSPCLGCLGILGENEKFKRTLKLFHKMVNGLDPPLDVKDEFGEP